MSCIKLVTVAALPKSVSVDGSEYGGGDLSPSWLDAVAGVVSTRSSSIHSSLSRKPSTSLKMFCNIAYEISAVVSNKKVF